MLATTPFTLTQADIRSMERMCYSLGVKDDDVIHDSIAKLFTAYDPARGASMMTFVTRCAIKKSWNLAKRDKYHADYADVDLVAAPEREYAEDALRVRWVTATKKYLAEQKQKAAHHDVRLNAKRAEAIFDTMVLMTYTDSLDLIAGMSQAKHEFFANLLAANGEVVTAKGIERAINHLKKVVRKAIQEVGR